MFIYLLVSLCNVPRLVDMLNVFSQRFLSSFLLQVHKVKILNVISRIRHLKRFRVFKVVWTTLYELTLLSLIFFIIVLRRLGRWLLEKLPTFELDIVSGKS
jgi:hypothetical protein